MQKQAILKSLLEQEYMDYVCEKDPYDYRVC
jgi:hypothetical protein